MELLVKINGRDEQYTGFAPYAPERTQEVKFSFRADGQRVVLEDFLRGYIVHALAADNDMQPVFGPKEDIEWFANNVPYHITQKNIDILAFHKNFKYTNAPLRYKYSVAEVKKDEAREGDVTQLMRYCHWAGGRLANGEVEMIQPLLIANEFSAKAINKAKSEDFNNRGILLVTYKVVGQEKIRFDILDG